MAHNVLRPKSFCDAWIRFPRHGVALFQERRTERALETSRNFSIPRASAFRNRNQKRIAVGKVVRGDTLVEKE